MGGSGGDPVRLHLLHEWMRSRDARVRAAAIDAMRRVDPDKALNPEIFELLMVMLKSPAESWWVKDGALQLIGGAPRDWIVPHVDLLVSFLRHEAVRTRRARASRRIRAPTSTGPSHPGARRIDEARVAAQVKLAEPAAHRRQPAVRVGRPNPSIVSHPGRSAGRRIP